MDINGYWPTLVSIILGLGVADLLGNLHRLIDARKHVVWDPLPLLWAVTVLLWLFNYWWAVATNLDGSQNARVVGDFVLLASPPIILFLMAASVLPHAASAEGRFDMRTDWVDRRSVFLTLFALNQSVTWVTVAITRHSISWDMASLLRTIALLLVLLALFLKSRRLEWIVALAILALVVLRLSMQTVR
jgi:hypothetical protein